MPAAPLPVNLQGGIRPRPEPPVKCYSLNLTRAVPDSALHEFNLSSVAAIAVYEKPW